MENKTELLSPAGSFEGLKAVIAAGADAVYIGGTRFGARAYADNPEEDVLLSAIDYAHLRGVRVYLTVNTLLKEAEMQELPSFVVPYYERGVDAVLVQDFGVLKTLHEVFPDLPLHASTQISVTGPFAARMLKEAGVSRIVPARELSLFEIRKIREESGLEIETFIHGALCFSYSGQCLMSSFLGGRSGNRGRCAQPCRLPYSMSGTSGALLSLKDLCTVDLLPEILEAGVCSLKIEGRMKAPEYAAGVTSVYRKYLDLYQKDPGQYRVSEDDRTLLYDLFHRSDFTEGYYRRRNGHEMSAADLKDSEIKISEAGNRLYREMHSRFLEHEKTISVEGKCTVRTGKKITVSVTCGTEHVTAEGPLAEQAKNRPLLTARIEENVRKTKGSGFEFANLDVDTDDSSFITMASLNAVRREAMDRLREKMLIRFRKEAPEAAPEATKRKETAPRETFTVSASFETEEQYRTLLPISGTDCLYYPVSLLHGPADAVRIIGECRTAGKQVIFALPRVDREGNLDEFLGIAGKILENGAAGFLASSIESFAHLKELHLLSHTAVDAGLYTWNRSAKEFFASEGILFDTAPFELNEKELYGRDNTNSELIVYGRTPLMVTAQCLLKNTEGCRHQSGFLNITDRKHTDFLIKNDCVFCYNVLYNSVPTSLIDEASAIRRMGFPRIRLAFTDEDAGKCKDISLQFVSAFLEGAKRKPGTDRTKGHFGRGVL